jgi:predicted transcriptional regulator
LTFTIFVRNNEAMSIETRKLNLINWLSSIQDEAVLNKMEQIQKEKNDWWDDLTEEDKAAINEGLNQLDRGEYTIHAQVRENIKKRLTV